MMSWSYKLAKEFRGSQPLTDKPILAKQPNIRDAALAQWHQSIARHSQA